MPANLMRVFAERRSSSLRYMCVSECNEDETWTGIIRGRKNKGRVEKGVMLYKRRRRGQEGGRFGGRRRGKGTEEGEGKGKCVHANVSETF